MQTRPDLTIASTIILAMLALSALGWALIPDAASVAVHFDLHGHANRFTDKTTALLQLPIAAMAATLLFWLAPMIQPRRNKRPGDATLLAVMTVGVTGLLALGHALTVFSAIGGPKIEAALLALAVFAFCLTVIVLAILARRAATGRNRT